MKKFFFWLAFIFLLGLTVVVIIEIGVRIYHAAHHEKSFKFVPDYYIGYRFSKNNHFISRNATTPPEFNLVQTTNNLGLIGEKNINIKAPKDHFRILALGDSFTAAVQVPSEQNFCSLLEGQLKNSEVINAGIPGYSPFPNYLYYKNYLRPLKPDVVIVQIFANDMFDDYKAKRRGLLSNGIPVRASRYFSKQPLSEQPTWLVNTKRFLIDHSKFVEYIAVLKAKYGEESSYNVEMEKMPLKKDNQEWIFLQDKAFMEENFKDTAGYLAAINEMVTSDGGKMIIIYIPLWFQLNQGQPASSNYKFPDGATIYLNQYLTEFIKSQHITYIDFTDIFRTLRAEDIYFYDDGHLKPYGHEVVAKELEKTVSKIK